MSLFLYMEGRSRFASLFFSLAQQLSPQLLLENKCMVGWKVYGFNLSSPKTNGIFNPSFQSISSPSYFMMGMGLKFAFQKTCSHLNNIAKCLCPSSAFKNKWLTFVNNCIIRLYRGVRVGG